ncbi:hypothetical protein D3H55_08010 [Bacillus salacetis]|uniref:Uncharacterized protein n=1 Tax=Bacillus salacetis TaxID=2315464 RepID=A0A3A1R417_9BACI|nr:hypothetical protein D3H55_08010 [Bacillus salacetis]
MLLFIIISNEVLVIAIKTPVSREEKSCSFFFESKTFEYREKCGTWDFSESNHICENSQLKRSISTQDMLLSFIYYFPLN